MADELTGAVVETTEQAETTEPLTEVNETGAIEEIENVEPTEPQLPEGQRSRDRAFKEMRQQAQAERERASRADEILGMLFEGEGDELYANARSFIEERPAEQIRAEMEAEVENERLHAENEQLSELVNEYQTRALMAQGLKDIQSIDSSVQSLDEVVSKYPTFGNYIVAGADSKTAYFAAKAEAEVSKVVSPAPIGKLNAEIGTKDYFTKDEVEAMTSAELDANWDKVKQSMKKWPV